METAAKLLYGSVAVVFTVAGGFFLYAASLGVDDWSWLGIGEFVWFGVLWLSLALVWWFVLLRDSDFMDRTR